MFVYFCREKKKSASKKRPVWFDLKLNGFKQSLDKY